MNSAKSQTSFHASMLQAWSAFSDEFISVWNETGTEMVYFNEAYSFFFGYIHRDDFKRDYSFFGFRKHVLNPEITQLLMNTIIRNGHWTEEVLLQKKDGEAYLGRLDIASFIFEGKTYFLQRIINIDPQRVFSENLFREIKKFEALFQYATLPILLLNKQGSIILANKQAIDLFEYSTTEIVSLRVEDLIPSRFRDVHLSHRAGYHSRPENRPMGRGMQLLALKKNGIEFPVEISLGHYMIDQEPHVIAFIIDVTQRTEIENMLRKQTAEMQQAKLEIEKLNEELEQKVALRTHELTDTLNKLEQSRDELTEALSKERELSDLKSRFVSMASHEFRTPLSTILSSVSLIGKYTEYSDQDKRDKHILRIRSAVSNLTDILNEFLSLGRIEEGKIQLHYTEFNLKEQLQLIINELRPITKAGQQIQYQHEGAMIAKLDLSLIRNIIINLVSNAIKFSPERSNIHVQSIVNDRSIVIKVQDEGMGIPDEDKKHLFERFFRGKNVVNIQGTGLGLHIVSRYIELMNGTISVESELDHGTIFIIKFDI
jgi:PAS domain S-box-containing protein